MTSLPVNGHIKEVEGAYYQVHFSWVPRPGELIDLYSFVDASTGHQARRFFEVIQVIHEIHDIVDRLDKSTTGNHFVTVVVRESSNPLLTGVSYSSQQPLYP